MLNDLKSRGVLDVYLFCTDRLCGMMEAIQAVDSYSHASSHPPNTLFPPFCKLQGYQIDCIWFEEDIHRSGPEWGRRKSIAVWRKVEKAMPFLWKKLEGKLGRFEYLLWISTGCSLNHIFDKYCWRAKPAVPTEHKKQAQFYQWWFSAAIALSRIPVNTKALEFPLSKLGPGLSHLQIMFADRTAG